jgi:hypothetical protein
MAQLSPGGFGSRHRHVFIVARRPPGVIAEVGKRLGSERQLKTI